MRILNLDKGLIMIDRDDKVILGYRMPHAELSSFRQEEGNKRVFISNRSKDLHERRFDAVYIGYKKNESPKEILEVSKLDVCYKLTEGRIDYQNTVNLPEFSLYKYLQGNCPN